MNDSINIKNMLGAQVNAQVIDTCFGPQIFIDVHDTHNLVGTGLSLEEAKMLSDALVTMLARVEAKENN